MKHIFDLIPNEVLPLLTAAVLLAAGGIALLRFLRKPDSAKLALVQEWLLWAVARAEMALGSGAGEKKLNMVYCWFGVRFPLLCRLISFAQFKSMVDDALDQLMLVLENDNVVEMFIGEECRQDGEKTGQL